MKKEENGYQWLVIATFSSVFLYFMTSLVENIEVIRKFFYSLALSVAGMAIVEGTKCVAKRENIKRTFICVLVGIFISCGIYYIAYKEITSDYIIFWLCLLIQVIYGFWLLEK